MKYRKYNPAILSTLKLFGKRKKKKKNYEYTTLQKNLQLHHLVKGNIKHLLNFYGMFKQFCQPTHRRI